MHSTVSPRFAQPFAARPAPWIDHPHVRFPLLTPYAARPYRLGKDPQPSHMRDQVKTTEDNSGVHINSGILNHGFYIAAMTLGGKTWDVLGKIWYVALTQRLRPEADFRDFVQATVDIAGELYGNGGQVQRVLAAAWSDVGLFPAVVGCSSTHPETIYKTFEDSGWIFHLGLKGTNGRYDKSSVAIELANELALDLDGVTSTWGLRRARRDSGEAAHLRRRMQKTSRRAVMSRRKRQS